MSQTSIEREPRVHRFTRKEYYAMGQIGLFGNKRVELIDGEILEMSPQKSPHAFGISNLTAIFYHVIKPGLCIRAQLPLNLGNRSEPEPDLAIVKGSLSDYKTEHPLTAELVVEFANLRISFNRSRKGSLYAKASIPEFWLVNLPDECVEVFRDPVKERGQPFGFKYESCQILRAGDTLSPLCLAATKIAVKDIMP